MTTNDPALTERMVPTLQRVAGAEQGDVGPLTGTAEDFSFFQQKVPGCSSSSASRRRTRRRPPLQNHSPLFFADESALPVGVRALTNLAVDYLKGQ